MVDSAIKYAMNVLYIFCVCNVRVFVCICVYAYVYVYVCVVGNRNFVEGLIVRTKITASELAQTQKTRLKEKNEKLVQRQRQNRKTIHNDSQKIVPTTPNFSYSRLREEKLKWLGNYFDTPQRTMFPILLLYFLFFSTTYLKAAQNGGTSQGAKNTDFVGYIGTPAQSTESWTGIKYEGGWKDKDTNVEEVEYLFNAETGVLEEKSKNGEGKSFIQSPFFRLEDHNSFLALSSSF